MNGDVLNDGYIQNSDAYGLSVRVSGDIQNSGTWNNYRTYLTGNNSRSITGNPLRGNIYIDDDFEILNSPVFNGNFYFGGMGTGKFDHRRRI